MSQKVFKQDLVIGVEQEMRILQQIKSTYPKAYKIDGYCKDWDLFIPEENIGIEVKSDQKSQYTGNIVIEFEFNGKPSALKTTKAEYWVIFDGECDVWIKPSRIKDCIIQNKLRYVEFTGRGDTHSKKAYLIKKEVLYPYANKIITDSRQICDLCETDQIDIEKQNGVWVCSKCNRKYPLI